MPVEVQAVLAARRVNDEKTAILFVVVPHREFAEIHRLRNRAQLEAMNHTQAVELVGEQLSVIVVGAVVSPAGVRAEMMRP